MFGGLLGTDPWFEPKKFGYGAGLPCAPQGWGLLAVFIAAISLIALFAERMGLVVSLLVIALVTIPFVILVHRHTRGGWR